MKKVWMFLIILLLSNNAYAYLDGGTGSMLLQLLLGGIAGLAAIIKIYWYRIKAIFKKNK